LQQVPGRNGVTYAANSTAPGALTGATVPYGNDEEGTGGQTTIDFSSSWTINKHFTLSLEGLNITNRPNYQWIDSGAQRLSFYHKTGRQFMFGGRYKF
jgi:outer membrane receptor protein involved in Fe transport